MNIALIGYGKMGRIIEDIATKRGHSITTRISSTNILDLKPSVLQSADMAIEFSRPEAAVENIKACILAGLPVVSGTTGWVSKKPEVDKFCLDFGGSFLYASNFSIGVNILFEINQKLAKLMNKYEVYDVDIHEIHHTEKLDAPSGTAITLANEIIRQLERKKVWTISPVERNSRSLHISSERTDPAPGTHIVTYRSEVDDIEIKHTAHTRTGFATGAVIAAEWLKGKTGVFSMKDLLEF
ncbi:MAG: 4-hydroxy-tetrahydrodipicolinate reductase [Saprospiraceae bacterium]|nr:4-hydroxy-tetrahydrodipicolinate reductase [Saprospiraceae bacterium]